MMASPWPWRCNAILFALVGLLVLTATAVRFLPSPLRYDETDFGRMAEATWQHGTPRASFAEDSCLYEPPTGWDARYGMWHPPLYIYCLSLAGGIGGFHEAALRGVGLISLLCSAFLTVRILRLLGCRTETIVLALALVFLTPLISEGSLFIDIDNTVLTTTLLLFAWLYLRDPDEARISRMLFLGVVLSLSLWAKLTTPFMMVAAIGAYQLLRRRLLLGIWQAGSIFAVALVLFAVGYGLYCWWFDYPWKFMFMHTFVGKKNLIVGGSALLRVAQSIRWNLIWVSPGVSAALLIALWMRLRAFWFSKSIERGDLLTLFFFFNAMLYVFWAGTIGKYTYPMVFSGLLILGWQLDSLIPQVKVRWSAGLVGLLIILFVIHLTAIPSLTLKPSQTAVEGKGVRELLQDPRIRALLFSLGTLICFTLVFCSFFTNARRLEALLLAALFWVLVANPVDIGKKLLAPFDIGPNRPLEERGFAEVVRFLNENSTPDDIILAPKDVGHYYRGKYHPLAWLDIQEGKQGAVRLLNTGTVRFYVDSDAFPACSPELWSMPPLAEHKPLRFGSFVVYQLSSQSP